MANYSSDGSKTRDAVEMNINDTKAYKFQNDA